MGRIRDSADFPSGYATWLAGVRARVRKLRDDRGLSLRAAAELVGVSFANLNKIETGATPEPTLGVLWDIAAGYGVPFGELLVGPSAATPAAEPEKPAPRKPGKGKRGAK